MKTKELLKDKCSRMESKRKKLLRSQTKEKSRTLELAQSDRDPERLAEVRTVRRLIGIDSEAFQGPHYSTVCKLEQKKIKVRS